MDQKVMPLRFCCREVFHMNGGVLAHLLHYGYRVTAMTLREEAQGQIDSAALGETVSDTLQLYRVSFCLSSIKMHVKLTIYPRRTTHGRVHSNTVGTNLLFFSAQALCTCNSSLLLVALNSITEYCIFSKLKLAGWSPGGYLLGRLSQ